ncbi:MAG: M48 family metalloprotease [Gammaproteobacteria bacterium]
MKKGSFVSVLAMLLSSLFMIQCSTNPVTHQRELHLVSQSQEVKIGEENYVKSQQASGGLYTQSPGLTSYIQTVGQKLAKNSERPDLPFEFVILNDSIPNAWALPGGKIAINRGLLVQLSSEAELAAVLAHEITHATARHGAKSIERGLIVNAGLAAGAIALSDPEKPTAYNSALLYGSQIASALIHLRYSRAAELEADHYGMLTMAKAGYDPMAAVKLQELFIKLSEERRSNWLKGLFASHPPSRDRAAANLALAQTLPSHLETGEKRYQEKIALLKKQDTAYKQHDKGQALLAKGDPAGALQAANAAIQSLPSEALFYSLKADSQAKLGDLNAALVSLDQGEKLNGQFFYIPLQKGKILAQMGDKSNAKAAFKRSFQLLPTEEAEAALKLL